MKRFLSCCLKSTVLVVCACRMSASANDEYRPTIARASKDAELAIQTFVIPEGMTVELAAAEPDIANPVAFCVSGDGTIYVCETFRQQKGVEDNRSHMDWLEADLQLETVEERIAMFRRFLGPAVEEYAKEHDRIRILRDTDNDGRVDQVQVFADGFHNIEDGTGAGVLAVGQDVYYTCIPNLWRLRDSDNDGKADEREILHHGYGVRVAFRGHDMHGLTRGPDGRIYFSIGDRGYNVITKEGRRLKRPDCGAVFRCDPDGSHLEVFAWGLRNPQELAFDDFGDLFTVDNNSDSGDQARLTCIRQDSDTGWRMYFQYLPDRGPWNRERMWYPAHADKETSAVQPPHILPPIANLSDGPSGLTFYPGLGLSDRYRDHFFLADFRGASANSGIRSFALRQQGAGYEVRDSHKFLWSILATDVDFAPDGSMLISDWVNGWNGEGKGRLYRLRDSANQHHVADAGVTDLLRDGVSEYTDERLLSLLGHADRRIRMLAQDELSGRKNVAALLQMLRQSPPHGIVRRHIVWALWQRGLTSATESRSVVHAAAQLLNSPGDTTHQLMRVTEDLIRRHGLNAVVDPQQRTILRAALARLSLDKNLRTAAFAIRTLGQLALEDDAHVISGLLVKNADTDPVIRHSCVVALTALATRQPQVLTQLAGHQNSLVRTAVALAAARTGDITTLRRLTTDSNATVVLAAARALTDEMTGVGDAEVAAAGHKFDGPPALTRRVMEAHFRLGKPANAEAVATIAASEKQPEAIRQVACRLLQEWNSPQQTNSVNGRWRPLEEREVRLTDALQPHLAGMLKSSESVRSLAIQAAAAHEVRDIIPELRQLFADRKAPRSLRAIAFRGLAKMADNVDELLNVALQDPAEEIRVAAIEILAQRSPASSVPALKRALESGGLREKQTALRLLSELGTDEAIAVVADAMKKLQAGQLPMAVALDLLSAAEKSGSDAAMQMVRRFRQSQAEQGTTVARWSECLEGGDAERGREIFFGRAAASCRRCHTVNGEGAAVGPDLSGIGKEKDRTYLLESIVDPNAKIAKGFETTIIVDFDGRVHSGIIKEETDKVVKLMTPQGAIVSIPVDEIEDRAKGSSGMPSDITKGLSRHDVRDLVEYLSTLKTPNATASHGDEK